MHGECTRILEERMTGRLITPRDTEMSKLSDHICVVAQSLHFRRRGEWERELRSKDCLARYYVHLGLLPTKPQGEVLVRHKLLVSDSAYVW